MKKNFIKPSISIDVFNTEHILLASGVVQEKTNAEVATEELYSAYGNEMKAVARMEF